MFFRKPKWLTLVEAIQMLYTKTFNKDVEDMQLERVGVTIENYYHYKLLYLTDKHGERLPLYGHRTFNGQVSKYSELKLIPTEMVPEFSNGRTRWSKWTAGDTRSTIFMDRTDEPIYTGIVIKREDLEKFLNIKRNRWFQRILQR